MIVGSARQFVPFCNTLLQNAWPASDDEHSNALPSQSCTRACDLRPWYPESDNTAESAA